MVVGSMASVPTVHAAWACVTAKPMYPAFALIGDLRIEVHAYSHVEYTLNHNGDLLYSLITGSRAP